MEIKYHLEIKNSECNIFQNFRGMARAMLRNI